MCSQSTYVLKTALGILMRRNKTLISELSKYSVCCSDDEIRHLQPDPPENWHLTVKKLPKTWHFFQKNWQKLSFFSTKLPMAILLQKNDNFCHFFWKKCQVLGNFLTVKWQFSGWSDCRDRAKLVACSKLMPHEYSWRIQLIYYRV